MAIVEPKSGPLTQRWPAEHRLRLGLTLADLGSASGVVAARIASWETGTAQPSESERDRVEAALRSGSPNGTGARRARTHVWLDEQGAAWLDDTGRKVREIAGERVQLGWSAEQILEQHPDLTLAQIHAALAYYYDNQAAVDDELEAEARFVEQRRREAGESPLVERLRAAAGKLR